MFIGLARLACVELQAAQRRPLLVPSGSAAAALRGRLSVEVCFPLHTPLALGSQPAALWLELYAMWCVQEVPEGRVTGGRVWAGGCPLGFAQGPKHGECIGALALNLYTSHMLVWSAFKCARRCHLRAIHISVSISRQGGRSTLLRF